MKPRKDIDPISFFINNQSAIGVASNTAKTKRRKHVDIRHHHLADAIHNNLIQTHNVTTTKNIADALTKPLAHEEIQYLFTNIITPNKSSHQAAS